MNQLRNVRRRGFTLIELMLAMSFVSLLLLAIAMTTMEIGRIYNKGVTLKSVNQVGRDISDELQRTIAAGVPFDVSTHYVSQPNGGGRLCLGSYSYVWNYGAAIAGAGGAKPMNVYADSNDVIRFAKVNDTNAGLCSVPYPKITRANAVELLTGGDHDLVIHRFDVAAQAKDDVSGQALYSITMTLGTNDQTTLASGNTSCRPPATSGGNEDFCSVNQFDIIARAGNRQ
jgi:prepilin-type N-terminal cleavage/methylation domain-containing protein